MKSFKDKILIPAILNEIGTDKCLQVTAMILSRYDFDDLSHPTQEYWCPFENFKCRFNDIFGKELIEVATLARVCLDIDDKFGSAIIVGKLSVNNNDKKLNFREACNKIIHAETYEIKRDWSERHPLDNGLNGYGESDIQKFKNPIIITEGKYKGEDWRAEIFFLKYIEILRERF